jgi:hypothetical protein
MVGLYRNSKEQKVIILIRTEWVRSTRQEGCNEKSIASQEGACEVHWESIVIAIYWDFSILEQEIEKKEFQNRILLGFLHLV